MKKELEHALRQDLADAIARYIGGQYDSAEVEKVLIAARNGDVLAQEISSAVDLFIDDFAVHRNEGKYSLDPKYECMLRRWVSLLRSNCEWPREVSPTRGILRSLIDAFRPEKHECLNNEFWPFVSLKDWESHSEGESASSNES